MLVCKSTRKKVRFLCIASSLIPILHFLCLYFTYTHLLILSRQHKNFFLYNLRSPHRIALYDLLYYMIHSILHPSTLFISFFSRAVRSANTKTLWPLNTILLHTTLNYYCNLFNNLFFLSPCDKYHPTA